ncbi:hypothetical protein [Curtobacterium sp. MCSS17_016]|uniref:hypothetical protein n=1 Tax=Curtobacterium sp. MCSS17_016 TaxID=2175644 RepID=UPI000DA81AC5|nr:hypothetical protein [Curtobacterium sp. MCSS17_016]WIE80953.1 hypothetical protein DEJ19_020770 [Curtobacterium sp. MCSS17_016]
MTNLLLQNGRPVGLAPESALIAVGDRCYVHSVNDETFIRVKAAPATDDSTRWETGVASRRTAADELEQTLPGAQLVGAARRLTIESVLYREYLLDIYVHPTV